VTGAAAAGRDAGTAYAAPRWLPGAHAQTIWPYFLARPRLSLRRERVDTPDDDFWDFDWLDAPAPDAPMVVLFHGLEGSSDSHYSVALLTALAHRGWRGVVPHFRSCGGTPNRQPRVYHSGDHEEIGRMLAAVRARVTPATPVYAVGVSLGGSALLNWLGRAGTSAAATLTAAAAVSAPQDLMAAGVAIGQGLNRLYTWHFLQTLKPKSLDLARRFPGLLDTARVRAAGTMWAFDDAVTAPLHGFTGTVDYWTRASSKPWLAGIGIPTLVLNATNDPFVPAASLASPRDVAAAVTLQYPTQGGHVGFLVSPAPGRIDWLPRRLLSFFSGNG
jgi:hypothetical protein